MTQAAGFWVYFGGTFDPPHLAHHELVKTLLQDPWVEKVFLVPTSKNPLKDPKPSDSRQKWMGLWVDALKEELSFIDFMKLTLDDFEVNSKDYSYTIDTLKFFRSRDPGKRWALAMGSDSLESLPKWKNHEELLSLVDSVWVFPRGSWTAKLKTTESLKNCATVRIMAQELPELSSTEIREILESPDAAQKIPSLPLLPSIKKAL